MRLSDILDIQYALAILFRAKLLQDGYADFSDVNLKVESSKAAAARLLQQVWERLILHT